MKKVRLNGFISHGRLYLSNLGKSKRLFPPYFSVEVDLTSIQIRNKSQINHGGPYSFLKDRRSK